MSIILKHILRTIRKNRMAGVLIIISLMISTAIIYLNLNIQNDLVAVSKSLFNGIYGGYDISIEQSDTGIDINDSAFEECQILPLKYGAGVYNSDSAEAPATIINIASDWEQAVDSGIVTLESGNLPTSTDSVGITQKKATYYKLQIGDTITVVTEDGTTDYTITCIYSSIGFFADEKREFIELLTAFDDTESADIIYADTDGIGKAEEIADNWKTQFPEWEISLTDEGASADKHMGDIRRILGIMLAMSVMMGYYVISSVSTMMLEGRLPEIGTFRSVGASRRTMNLFLLIENILYGIIGGIVGVVIGEGLRVLLRIVYYHTSQAEHTITPLFVLIGFAFSVVMQIGITAVTLIKTGRRSIKDTIFTTSAVKTEISPIIAPLGLACIIIAAAMHLLNVTYIFWLNTLALVLAVFGCICIVPVVIRFYCKRISRRLMKRGSSTLFLSFKNLYASRIDISSAILTAAVTALSLVIFLCTVSVSAFYERYADNYPYDIFIKSLHQMGENYDFVAELEGVEAMRVEYWDFCDPIINGTEHTLCFVRRGGYSNGIEVSESLLESLQNGHTIVDEAFAKKNGMRKGDILTIELGDTSFELMIDDYCNSGIFNSKRATLMMTEADYDQYVTHSPALLGIYLSEDASEDEMLTELSTAIYQKVGENVSVNSKNAYLSGELDKSKDTLAVFAVIPAFTVILAVIGLVNNQIISYQRKRREYAVLYSVAMNRKQLGRMVFAEVVLTFTFGSLCGIAMSLWLVRIVRDILYGLISYVEINYDMVKIGIIFIGALSLLCLTAIIPGRMAKNTNVVEEIKYE